VRETEEQELRDEEKRNELRRRKGYDNGGVAVVDENGAAASEAQEAERGTHEADLQR
jgi:hypothetical protein